MLQLAGSARIPVSLGDLEVRNYVDAERSTEVQVVLPASGVDGDPAVMPLPLVRVHSQCWTGDLLGSLRCDCGPQFDWALSQILAVGHGALIYLPQEGRGIGLSAKLQAYVAQDAGLDTVDANVQLGLPVDSRSYAGAAEIMRHLGWRSIRLITNNPDKVQQLRLAGLHVERLETPVFVNSHNRRYLGTKRTRMSHDLKNL